MLLVPNANAPPAVVIDTALLVVPVVAEPVRVNPPAVSLTVSAPPRCTVPRLVIVLALPKLMLLAVLAVSVFALITVLAFCVTAPLMSPATPSVTVPEFAVMLPSAAVVALWIVTALPVALVVVRFPAMLIAPPPPFTRIVPAPELRTDPAICETPPLLDTIRMFPPRVVMLPAAPNDTPPPGLAFRLTAREFAPVPEIEALTATEPTP